MQGQSNCHLTGTQYGATAVSQCSRLTGLAAGTIIYYLYPSPAALTSRVSTFLSQRALPQAARMHDRQRVHRLPHRVPVGLPQPDAVHDGHIAEYTSTSNDPIITTSDNQQNVMAVMVGTNAGDLLSYWKQLNWIVR